MKDFKKTMTENKKLLRIASVENSTFALPLVNVPHSTVTFAMKSD